MRLPNFTLFFEPEDDVNTTAVATVMQQYIYDGLVREAYPADDPYVHAVYVVPHGDVTSPVNASNYDAYQFGGFVWFAGDNTPTEQELFGVMEKLFDLNTNQQLQASVEESLGILPVQTQVQPIVAEPDGGGGDRDIMTGDDDNGVNVGYVIGGVAAGLLLLVLLLIFASRRGQENNSSARQMPTTIPPVDYDPNEQQPAAAAALKYPDDESDPPPPPATSPPRVKEPEVPPMPVSTPAASEKPTATAAMITPMPNDTLADAAMYTPEDDDEESMAGFSLATARSNPEVATPVVATSTPTLHTRSTAKKSNMSAWSSPTVAEDDDASQFTYNQIGDDSSALYSARCQVTGPEELQLKSTLTSIPMTPTPPRPSRVPFVSPTLLSPREEDDQDGSLPTDERAEDDEQDLEGFARELEQGIPTTIPRHASPGLVTPDGRGKQPHPSKENVDHHRRLMRNMHV